MDPVKIASCEHCGDVVIEGQGVDHELNETEVVVFCNMDHFKLWIDKHMKHCIHCQSYDDLGECVACHELVCIDCCQGLLAPPHPFIDYTICKTCYRGE